MKKLNTIIASLTIVALATLLLTSCHRSGCPTYGNIECSTQDKI